MSLALDVLLLATGCAHVFLAPYTKVEESFNLHAIHDVLMYGVGRDALPKYDHFVFPGAVPRTFIGSVLIAWLTKLLIPLAEMTNLLHDKVHLQILVRLVLVLYNVTGFALLRRAVESRYGRLASVFFTLLTCTQANLPFWMGRTIPNMFALLPVNAALYFLHNRAPHALRPTQRNVHIAIALLTFTTVVFRSEVLLFLGPLVFQSWLSGYTSIKKIVKVGIVSGLLSVALTAGIDSYFWQQPLWPEFSGIWFNVFEGKSSDWGVSPFNTYFINYLPKITLSSFFLALAGAVIDHRVRALIWPSLLFVALMSGLGHKEWRFIVYVVPVFNMAAARSATYFVGWPKNKRIGRFFALVTCGFLVLNLVYTCLYVASSKDNYPGGKALAQFNDMYHARDQVHVHLSNLAAQTGASLFLQTHSAPYLPSMSPPETSHWVYHKTEHLNPKQITASPHLTHVIAELSYNATTKTAFQATGFPANQWRLTRVITSTDIKLGLREKLKGALEDPWSLWPESVPKEKLAILERK